MKTMLTDRFAFKTQRIKDDKGYLLAPASISRIGIQQYTSHECGLDLDKPNRIVNVMRKDSDVFDADSLASFKTAILTNDHPKVAVDAGNAKELSVGFIDGPVKTSSNTVDADLVWTDADTINAIDTGKEEISVGYSCDLVPERGVFEDKEYELIQTNIRANHVALVDKGRAGSSCVISDSAKALDDLLRLHDGENTATAPVEAGSSDFEAVAATNKDNGDIAALKEQAESLLKQIQMIEGGDVLDDDAQGGDDEMDPDLEGLEFETIETDHGVEEAIEEHVEEELEEHENELHADDDFEAPEKAWVQRDGKSMLAPWDEVNDDEPWMTEDDYATMSERGLKNPFADGCDYRDSMPDRLVFGDREVITAELSDNLLELLTCITEMINGKDQEIEAHKASLGQKDDQLMASKAQYDDLSGQMESMKANQMPEELTEMVGDSGDTVFDLMDNMIEERIALIADASKLVPELEAKGKSCEAIKREVVQTRVPKLTQDKLDNVAYIDARFEAMLEIVDSGHSQTLAQVFADAATKDMVDHKPAEVKVDLVEEARKAFAASSKK